MPDDRVRRLGVLADINQPFLDNAHQLAADVRTEVDVLQVGDEAGLDSGVAPEAVHGVGNVIAATARG